MIGRRLLSQMLGRKARADGKQLCESGERQKKGGVETSEGSKLIWPTSRSLPGKHPNIQAEGEEVKPSEVGVWGGGSNAELSGDDALPQEGASLWGGKGFFAVVRLKLYKSDSLTKLIELELRTFVNEALLHLCQVAVKTRSATAAS